MHLAGRARSERSGDSFVGWLAADTSVLFGFARRFLRHHAMVLHIEAWFRLWRNNLPLHSSYRGLRGSIREEKGVGYGVYLSVAGGDFA